MGGRVSYYAVIVYDNPKATGWYEGIDVEKVPHWLLGDGVPFEAYNDSDAHYLLLTRIAGGKLTLRIANVDPQGRCTEVKHETCRDTRNKSDTIILDGLRVEQYRGRTTAMLLYEKLENRSRADSRDLQSRITKQLKVNEMLSRRPSLRYTSGLKARMVLASQREANTSDVIDNLLQRNDALMKLKQSSTACISDLNASLSLASQREVNASNAIASLLQRNEALAFELRASKPDVKMEGGPALSHAVIGVVIVILLGLVMFLLCRSRRQKRKDNHVTHAVLESQRRQVPIILKRQEPRFGLVEIDSVSKREGVNIHKIANPQVTVRQDDVERERERYLSEQAEQLFVECATTRG